MNRKAHYLKWTRFSILFLIMLSFSGCLSVKPGSTKSGIKYYESFFVGEDGVQYFIKPLELQSASNSISLDFVFRYKDKADGQVIVNYSVLSNKILKRIDQVIISNNNIKVTLLESKFLFNEKDDENFASRFSTTTRLDSLIQLFKDSNWSVNVITLDEPSAPVYKTTKKTRNAIESLYDNVFILF